MPTQELIGTKHQKAAKSRRKPSLLPGPSAGILTWSPLHKLVYLGSDLFGLTTAHMLAVRVVKHFLKVPYSSLNPFEYHRYYILFFAVVLYLFEGYKSPELRRPEQELARSCKSVVVGFLGLVLFNFIAFRSQVFSRQLLVVWFFLSTALLVAMRFGLRILYGALWSAGLCRRKALLIGSSAGLYDFQQHCSIQRHHGYEFVGALLDSAEFGAWRQQTPEVTILGTPEDWEKALMATGAKVVIVGYAGLPDGKEWLRELFRGGKKWRIDVEIYSRVLATENLNYEHDEFSGCFRFFPKPAWSVTVQRAVRTGINVTVGVVGSVAALLMTPIIYCLVRLEDGGPLFYRSAYVAQDGSNRFYLKFRTMRADADRILERDAALRARFREKQKLIDDPRVTRVGRVLRKYSLDEFPEFFSVLKSDLSLVGPRTIRQEEAEFYGQHLAKLLSCKPGLTGFWQVMGRQTTTYQERVEMDMFYIDHWSIWLDLTIIAKTFWQVIRAEGAY